MEIIHILHVNSYPLEEISGARDADAPRAPAVISLILTIMRIRYLYRYKIKRLYVNSC